MQIRFENLTPAFIMPPYARHRPFNFRPAVVATQANSAVFVSGPLRRSADDIDALVFAER